MADSHSWVFASIRGQLMRGVLSDSAHSCQHSSVNHKPFKFRSAIARSANSVGLDRDPESPH